MISFFGTSEAVMTVQLAAKDKEQQPFFATRFLAAVYPNWQDGSAIFATKTGVPHIHERPLQG